MARGRSGHTCCVPECSNNTLRDKHLSWHQFPSDTVLKKKWVSRINRKGSTGKFSLWEPRPSNRICGAHFNASGRKTYDDKLPRFFPRKTYPVATPHQSRPKICKLPVPACTAPSSGLEPDSDNDNMAAVAGTALLPEHPIELLPESDVGSMVTVPGNGAPQPISTIISASETTFFNPEHSYSVRPSTPVEAPSTQRSEEVLALIKKNCALEADLKQERERNEALQARIRQLECEVARQQAELLKASQRANFSSADLLDDQKLLRFYTGFERPDRFLIFCEFVEAGYTDYKNPGKRGRPHVLSVRDELTLVLMRLRLGLLEEDLANRFKISTSSVSAIFIFWLEFLALYLDQVPRWPSRQLIDQCMPEVFKQYPQTRIILDCTEIFIETPSDYNTQSDTYSTYKSHNTAKGLIGISPNGYVTFVADLAPGRVSDKAITKSSGLYNLLERGDSVMADRGFVIEEDLNEVGATLNIPPFLNGKPQLSIEEEKQTREIAKVRIHVERVIAQVKTFRILKFVFPNTMADSLNAVWTVCALLCNFINEPLVDRKSCKEIS